MRSSDPPPWAGHSGLPILVGLGSGLTRPPWAGQHHPIVTVPLSRLVRSPGTHCRGLPPWQPSRIAPSPSVTSGPRPPRPPPPPLPLLPLVVRLLLPPRRPPRRPRAGAAATRPGALGLLAAVAARPTVLASTTERKAVHPVEVVPTAADLAETAALARVAVRTPLGQALLLRRCRRRRRRLRPLACATAAGPATVGLLAAVAARTAVLASTTGRGAVQEVDVVPAAAHLAEDAALARAAVRTPCWQHALAVAEALVAGARATAPPLVATTATAARRPPGRALHQRRRLGRSPRQRKNRWGGG